MEIYDEDTLTEFELGRQRNIIRNYEFMKACGLPVKPLVYVKRVHVPLEEQFKYLSESSDSSDEEWTMAPKKKKEDKNVPKSADIRRKVSNPTAFFKKKEKEEREQKENREDVGECSKKKQAKKCKMQALKEDKSKYAMKTSQGSVAPQSSSSCTISAASTSKSSSSSSSSSTSSSSFIFPGGVGDSNAITATKKQTNDKHFIRQRPKLPPLSPKNNNNSDGADAIKVDVEVKSSRYPKRGPRINYSETEVPDDDHFLFCEQCQEYYQGECSEHCIIRPIADSSVSNSSKTALSSLPEGMEVRESSIKDAGLGVFAKKQFLSGATFGPYAGEKVRADVPKVGLDTSYMWEIVKDLKVAYYINGKNEEQANWMRYVNCSRVEEEQNMVAYQFHGNIFYRVYKDVQAGTEFLVWYGDEYAGELGITLEDSVKCISDEKFVVFKCDWCSICYTCGDGLLKHQKYCRKNPAKTHGCENVGNTKEALGELPRKHGKSRCSLKKSHFCHICGKAFNTPTELKRHIRIHTGEKPFCCQQCGRKFSQKGDLTRHQLIHTQAQALICEVCRRQFTQASDLKRHMHTHTGETPYKCDVCGEGFRHSSCLKNHMSKHTGVKHFKCEQCDYETNITGDLKRHILTHTGETPFKCDVCGQGFKQRSHLKRHMSKHTGVKEDQSPKTFFSTTQL